MDDEMKTLLDAAMCSIRKEHALVAERIEKKAQALHRVSDAIEKAERATPRDAEALRLQTASIVGMNVLRKSVVREIDALAVEAGTVDGKDKVLETLVTEEAERVHHAVLVVVEACDVVERALEDIEGIMARVVALRGEETTSKCPPPGDVSSYTDTSSVRDDFHAFIVNTAKYREALAKASDISPSQEWTGFCSAFKGKTSFLPIEHAFRVASIPTLYRAKKVLDKLGDAIDRLAKEVFTPTATSTPKEAGTKKRRRE